jgi:putative transposase
MQKKFVCNEQIFIFCVFIHIFTNMSGDRYNIQDKNATYFFTFTVVDWIDIFTKSIYNWIIVDALNYCINNKGLVVNAYVIMSNHIHIICYAKDSYDISNIIRDFKKYTSKQIVRTIINGNESRKEWILNKLSFEAKRTGRAKNYKLWKDDNHAIEIDGLRITSKQKINYIHENPVKEQIVENAEYFIFSSARDYIGIMGHVKIEIL